jgi:hypothetical protein
MGPMANIDRLPYSHNSLGFCCRVAGQLQDATVRRHWLDTIPAVSHRIFTGVTVLSLGLLLT